MSGSHPIQNQATLGRALLTAYSAEQDTLHLNEFIAGSEHLSRELVDDFLGVPPAELTRPESSNDLPSIWFDFAKCAPGPHFLKAHSCFQTNAQGVATFPATVSRAVIKIVQNPLDIALSYAEQFSNSIEEYVRQRSLGHWQQQSLRLGFLKKL